MRQAGLVRYNLAFVLPISVDNGRVLGYDNAHGAHGRHADGKVTAEEFKSYSAVAQQFEVRAQF